MGSVRVFSIGNLGELPELSCILLYVCWMLSVHRWLNNTGLGSECEDVLLFTGNWTGYPNSVLGEARQSVNIYQGI